MIHNALSVFSPTIRQYIIVILLKLHCIPFGISLSWPSSEVVKLSNENTTVLPDPVTSAQGAWIISMPYASAFFATMTVGFLVDNLGRRAGILLMLVPKLLAVFLLLFASQLWMVYLARALEGLTFAFIFAVFPLYASEIASEENRGPLGTLLQLIVCVGGVIALGVGPFTSYVTLQIVLVSITVITAIPLIFLPETPYYLHTKGRKDEALNILTVLRGSVTLAEAEMNGYTQTTKTEINYKSLLRDKAFLKPLSLCIVLSLGIPFIGGDLVTFYIQTIMDQANTTMSPEITSLVIGFIRLGAAAFTPLVINRLGRKTMLLATAGMILVGMIGLGISFQIEQPEGGSNFLNILPMISVILVTFGFSCGPTSVFWLILSELFDGPTRGVGASFSMFATYPSFVLVIQFFPIMTEALGAANTFWFFTGTNTLYILFVIFCLPETKGKTFAEIQMLLTGRTPESIDKLKEEI